MFYVQKSDITYLRIVFMCVGLDPGLVGLSITYALSLTNTCQYTIKNSTEVESLVRISVCFSFVADDVVCFYRAKSQGIHYILYRCTYNKGDFQKATQ